MSKEAAFFAVYPAISRVLESTYELILALGKHSASDSEATEAFEGSANVPLEKRPPDWIGEARNHLPDLVTHLKHDRIGLLDKRAFTSLHQGADFLQRWFDYECSLDQDDLRADAYAEFGEGYKCLDAYFLSLAESAFGIWGARFFTRSDVAPEDYEKQGSLDSLQSLLAPVKAGKTTRSRTRNGSKVVNSNTAPLADD